jgi:hypothetical protein
MIKPDYLDMTGHSPENSAYLVGKSYLHTRTGVRYEVFGFAWIGDLDQWGVLHRSVIKENPTVYIRSLANFRGKHLDGMDRFTDAQIL